jgi:hypothetical protein
LVSKNIKLQEENKMKNYLVTLEKTISLRAENEEDIKQKVQNIESNSKIKEIVEVPKYRYVTFEELIDMYAAPKSPIEHIKTVYADDEKASIVWFSVKFKDSKNASTLMVKNLGKPAPTDAPYWFKREVE